MLFWIWLGVIISILWLWMRKKFSYFKEMGVKNLPTVPILGNWGKVVTKREHVTTFLDRCYYSFPTERYVSGFIPYGI